MDSDDMFLDSERLKKMIALGIYDDKTVDKVRNIKNKDLIDKTPVARPPDPLDTRPTPAPPNQPMGGRGGGGGRGGPHNRGGPEGWRSQRANPGRRDFGYGFNPIADSVVNWSTFGDNSAPKRSKTFTGDDSFRSSIRDGIQTKIQRNEDDRKMNIHLMGDRYPATDEDFRGRGRRGRGMDHNRHFDADQRERDVFGERSAPRDPMLSQPVVDDIDDFIARAERAVSGKPSTPQKRKHEMSGSGRGGPHRPDQRPADQKPLFERPRRIDDNMSQRRSGALFGSNDSSDEFKASDALNPSFGRRLPPERPVIEVLDEPRVESEANPVKQMEELRNTVEELSSSNLYCQYCDFYLSSFNDINSHIGTVLHQQNMAKKSMENSAQSVPKCEPMNRTVVERVPIGMAALVKMIDNRKQITLKSLTDMESYQICSDSEASLAKELAKLLTNELLNYKMSLMPDNVKEALKHQGIGLLKSATNM